MNFLPIIPFVPDLSGFKVNRPSGKPSLPADSKDYLKNRAYLKPKPAASEVES